MSKGKSGFGSHDTKWMKNAEAKSKSKSRAAQYLENPNPIADALHSARIISRRAK